MTHDVSVVCAEIEALNVEFWYRVDHENGDPDGTWRMRHRHIEPAFVGDDAGVLPFGRTDATVPAKGG
jgi:hypothetical protein